MDWKSGIKSIYGFAFFLFFVSNINAQNKKFVNGQVFAFETAVRQNFPKSPLGEDYISMNKNIKVIYLQNLLRDSIFKLRNRPNISQVESKDDLIKTESDIKVRQLQSKLDSSQEIIKNLQYELVLCDRNKERIFNDNERTIEELNRATAQYNKLLEQIKYGKSTKHYDVTRIREPEVVISKRGLYFAVDIKNPQNEKIIYFDEGLYYINMFDTHYLKSLSEFDKDILSIIRSARKSYEIFIRGSADASSNNFQKPLNPLYNFSTISILRRSSNQVQYEFEEVSKTIGSHFGNIDLPNLRAQFIYNQLNTDAIIYPKDKLHILDGTVTPKTNPMDRNVRIYLYLKDN